MKTHDELRIGANLVGRTDKSNETMANFFALSESKFEVNRFGLMAAIMVFQVCLASIAIYFIFEGSSSTWQLMTVTLSTMFCNAMLIAQASPRLCLISFYVSALSSVSCILINIILF